MASNRITIKGILSGEYSFERPSFGYGYGTETVTIYKISSEDGKVYVWKTTGSLSKQVEVPFETRGAYLYDSDKHVAYMLESPDKGDAVKITASIKGESEYKGEMQTELQRVKLLDIIRKEEVKVELKKQDLTLADGDQILEMPYKQYKEHYSDCETVKGSFFRDEFTGESKIKVIIRNGRMKASGVRGQKFMYYIFNGTENGRLHTFCAWAVCEENARKQLTKEFPHVTDMVLIRTCKRNGKGQMY